MFRSDLPHEVSDTDIELFEDQFPKFNGVYKTSCKTNEGVDDMFRDIAEKLSGSSSLKATIESFKLHAHGGVDACCSNNEESSKDNEFCCTK